MIKNIFCFSLLIAFCHAALAQSNEYDYVMEKPFLTKKEFGFGAVLHTSGWGISFRKGENQTVTKKRMLEVELISMKHPKEYKTVTYVSERPKSFVFGKMNGLLVLHGGYRMERILFTKTEKNTFEIRLNFTAGPSFGITKPVYYIYKISNTEKLVEKFNTQNPRSVEETYGKAEFTKGLNELNVYPGLHLKTGTMFEYNPLNDGITAIEVGMMLDVYAKKIPIMAFAKNKQVWFNFYATLVLGRKS